MAKQYLLYLFIFILYVSRLDARYLYALIEFNASAFFIAYFEVATAALG